MVICHQISELPFDQIEHLDSVLEETLQDDVQAVAEILRLGNDLFLFFIANQVFVGFVRRKTKKQRKAAYTTYMCKRLYTYIHG